MVTKRKNLWKTRIHVPSSDSDSVSHYDRALHTFDQQMAAYPETASLDSVILVLWYLCHDYPILEVFESLGQSRQDRFYLGEQKEGLQNLDNSDLD